MLQERYDLHDMEWKQGSRRNKNMNEGGDPPTVWQHTTETSRHARMPAPGVKPTLQTTDNRKQDNANCNVAKHKQQFAEAVMEDVISDQEPSPAGGSR